MHVLSTYTHTHCQNTNDLPSLFMRKILDNATKVQYCKALEMCIKKTKITRVTKTEIAGIYRMTDIQSYLYIHVSVYVDQSAIVMTSVGPTQAHPKQQYVKLLSLNCCL